MLRLKSYYVISVLYLISILSSSCSQEGEKISCPFSNPFIPTQFNNCSEGSGSFGEWIIDENGLPAFEYTLEQEKSNLALYWNSEDKERRDHWHQIGNFRLTAIALNDGYIQVFSSERGFKWLNYYDEENKNYAGGFSYIYDGETFWSTSYKYKPEEAEIKRVFGIGYFQTEMKYRDIVLKKKIYPPFGDDPILISDVEITNLSALNKKITHYEYWDINIHQLKPAYIASGMISNKIPSINERERNAINNYFTQMAITNTKYNALLIKTSSSEKPPPPEVSSYIDFYPETIFLTPLDNIDGTFISDQNEFFGVKTNQPDEKKPLCLIHKTELEIKSGEIKKMSYAYGYTSGIEALDILLNKYKQNKNNFNNNINHWKDHLVYFAPQESSHLQREMAWHSYYLQSASVYNDYFKTHTVNQGGQYLFGHGFDGAPRDYALFTIPLVYINPWLAREILKQIMEMTDKNGKINYAVGGFGKVAGEPVHSTPSDVDIFFLWAISEYILVTRDFDFLEEKIPFYSENGLYKNSVTTSVFDHITLAINHLFNDLGFGEHNLLRISDGDWNDGISLFAKNRRAFIENGESIFNTAIACYVVELLTDLISFKNKGIESFLRDKLKILKSAFSEQWNGKWYLRAWLGDGSSLGNDQLFLEPQPWAIISGIADKWKQSILIENIYEVLDKPSPIGAMILYPPSSYLFGGNKMGTDINGGIWHAINATLTWAYSIYNPSLGWESFKKNTLTAHAKTYPDLWYGIWSGPDSYNSYYSERPGEASAHIATALTDFPIMNSNQHSNPLLALIRIAGIEPYKDGLKISPRIPLSSWSLQLPLLGITAIRDDYSLKLKGYYKGINNGKIAILISLSDELNKKQEFSINIDYKKDIKYEWDIETSQKP